jgi:hypothetical protein
MPRSRKKPQDEMRSLASGYWEFPSAKAQFSKLYRAAVKIPQLIVRQPTERVVMVNGHRFGRLVARSFADEELRDVIKANVLDLFVSYVPGRKVEL